MKSSTTQVLAEMCQSGYKDALRFLEENSEYPTIELPYISLTSLPSCDASLAASTLTDGLLWFQTC